MTPRTWWILTIVVIAILLAKDMLSFWGFVGVIFLGSFLADTARDVKKLKVKKTDHDDKLSDSTKEELNEAFERFRERVAQHQERQRRVATDDAIALDRSDIVKLRNTLLRHHNGRGTDKAYQESATGKDTLVLLQKLNELTQEKRRHD